MGQATFDEVTLLSDPGRENEALKIVIQQYDSDLVGTAYRISNSSSLNSKPAHIFTFTRPNRVD